jgi:hypothetical protein
MPALGSRKPSDLMAAMLETCPRGEENSNLFACIFLQRLPLEIRVLLANVDHKDPKVLATRVDELWALHDNPGSSISTVAVVQPEGQEVDFVAAVRSGSQREGNSSGGARGGNRGRGGCGAARGGGAAHKPEASKEARLAAGMCFKHWRYGDAATSCTPPAAGRETAAPGQLNAIAPGELLHLSDELSGRRFLFDTGASYSIFPHQSSQPVSGPVLKGPGGQTIPCWGEKQLPVQFSGCRFTWTFLLAKVEFPILGADFLKHINLIVDHSHVFIIVVDRSARWPEAIPLAGTTTADCVEAFLNGWVSRFGVPAVVTSDRGVQFTSAVWSGLYQRLGISHKLTTAYHPQANGLVERFHRQLKEALQARLENRDGSGQLPWMMMGLRAAPKEDCGLSFAELVYGEPLTLPGEFLEGVERPPPGFTQLLRQQMSGFEPPASRPQFQHPVSAALSSLMQAQFVYIKRGPAASSLSPLYAGPYRVVERGQKYFRLDVGGRSEAMSVDRLKASPRQLPPATSKVAQERTASGSRLLCSHWNWRPRMTSRVAEARGPPLGGVVWRTENPPIIS